MTSPREGKFMAIPTQINQSTEYWAAVLKKSWGVEANIKKVRRRI
tara:strand:- start:202 stop:336 length:135 start_codon:yes stop_codon:yes gene_type:complete